MWDIDIRNIGGIQSASVEVDDGLNVVQASNFSGKSSFMSAVQTVMGSSGMFGESHPLTEGAADGSVQLETSDGSYDVSLERTDSGAVSRRGTPYLDSEMDQTCARLFAFLGETNPIRSRIRNRENVTDLLQAPLDIEDIDSQIAALKQQRDTTNRRLAEARQAAENIPAVTEAIRSLEGELSELRDQRDELSQRGVEETAADTDLSAALADKRRSLRDTTESISRLQNRISRTEDQVETKEATLADIEIPDDPEISNDVAAKEDRIETIELQLDLLESLKRVNERVIAENEVAVVASVERSVIEDEFDCWVCGETTTEADIQSRLAALEEKIATRRAEKETLSDEITEIQSKQRRIREKRRKRERLEESIGELRATIEDLKSDLHQSRERKDRLESEVQELEAQVAQAEEATSEELTDVKAEIRTKESELSEQESRLEALEAESENVDQLEARAEELSEEIERLRGRKTNKQWEIKEQFDHAIESAIETFAPGFDGARLDVKTTSESEITEFELVIAREGRETRIDNLSEGERELLGILVAVAGYRTFDVADRVPVILLDGVSQLAADNLRELCEYLSDASDILLTTAYPEAGDFGTHTISPAAWDLISDEDAPAV